MYYLLSTYTGPNVKRTRLFLSIFSSFVLPAFFSGCAGIDRAPDTEVLPPAPSVTVSPVGEAGNHPPAGNPALPDLPEPFLPVPEPSVLELTFAGDIMAHTVNYSMKEYGRIYDDVRGLLTADDLTFGNLETPVEDTLPLSTYPRFNVHTPYLAAAVSGGFDVFSLANNHSNDQGTKGISGTLTAAAAFGPLIFSSGLKKTATDAAEPVLIEKNGWRILFLSVTEILNAHDAAGKLVYYISPTETSRTAFLAELVRMRQENPCDAFVLSLHLSESEYGRTVTEAKKTWFRRLAASGIDVVWAHHPHVMQGWETVDLPSLVPPVDIPPTTGDAGPRHVLFMYSMGNFISGQREFPATDNPKGLREYTGDAVLLQVRLTRTGQTGYDTMHVAAVPVTNYTDPEHGVVVRHFTAEFMESLPPGLQPYFRKRSELMRAYLPLLPTTPTRDILVP